MKGKILRFEEIKEAFPDMWVLIGDYEVDKHNEIIKGRVSLASYRKSDIYRDMYKFKGKVKRVAIRYTGKIPEFAGLLFSHKKGEIIVKGNIS